MNKGYLICKEVYETLEDIEIERKVIYTQNKEQNETNPNEKVKAIKCPLTGEYIEKIKIRKVYFC